MGSTFDTQAATYNCWYATPLGSLVDRLEKDILFGLMPELRGRRLLEVGCGTGNISLALAQRGAKVVGLELSMPMLTLAHDKAQREKLDIVWIRGTAYRLPFGDEVFDGVLCILALDFMANRPEALQEMVRVLRRGGFLTLAMLNRFSLWATKRLLKAWLKPSLWRGVDFITPKKFIQLLLSQPILGKLRSAQAIYFPPWGNKSVIRYYPYLENLARKLHLQTGAFMAATVLKQ